MTFDMNAAWQDATALLRSNKELLLVIAGLFFFLPGLAFALYMPDIQNDLAGLEGEAAFQAVMDLYSRAGPWFVFSTLLQSVGVLTMLALLRSQQKPTVSGAMKIGVTALLPYLGAQILLGISVGFALAIPLMVGAASGIAALVVVLTLIAIGIFVYLMVKFSMVAPIMAIEGKFNPIAAIQQSWAMTKGNSLRILLFFVLVGIAIIVIAILVMMVATLISSLAGTSIIEGLFSALVGAVYTTVFTAVLAATFRQLSGPDTSEISETFD